LHKKKVTETVEFWHDEARLRSQNKILDFEPIFKLVVKLSKYGRKLAVLYQSRKKLKETLFSDSVQCGTLLLCSFHGQEDAAVVQPHDQEDDVVQIS
jgi:hypothetical protein